MEGDGERTHAMTHLFDSGPLGYSPESETPLGRSPLSDEGRPSSYADTVSALSWLSVLRWQYKEGALTIMWCSAETHLVSMPV